MWISPRIKGGGGARVKTAVTSNLAGESQRSPGTGGDSKHWEGAKADGRGERGVERAVTGSRSHRKVIDAFSALKETIAECANRFYI
jgi:hypothetical protein